MTTAQPELLETPFHPFHVSLGGKMVDFAGWHMPVQYSTITLEHQAVRQAVGVFDISHMGQVLVWGRDAEKYLQNVLTNDVRKATLGKGIYAHILNENGGVIDDIFVYRLEPEKFLLVVNASRKEVDLSWLTSHLNGADAAIMEAPFAAALAIQGPKAAELLQLFSTSISDIPRFGIADVILGDTPVLAARTGYTGEDGFEIFAPAGHLLQFWDELFKIGPSRGLVPCGLGARDTLRTEVAYPLYGHELNEKHTPLEAKLGWVVSFDKGDFIGKEALIRQKSAGITTKLFGFQVHHGGVARPGGIIYMEGRLVGEVASGTFSPTLGTAIGLAYLPADTAKEGAALQIQQGSRTLNAVTVSTPFLKKKN